MLHGTLAVLDVTRTLLSTYLFQDLTPAQVDAISAFATVRRIARSEHIFRCGDPADEIWVLASGQIREYRTDVAGNEYVSELLSPGAVFGEPGAFARERSRMVNEVAVIPSEVIRIERGHLYRFLLRHPAALERLLEGLASEARAAVQDVPRAAHSPVAVRVVERLLLLAATHGVEDGPGALRIDLRVTQSELAAMVGCTRENVNRVLAALVQRGLVRLERRRILILDQSGLERASDRGEPVLHRRNRRIPEVHRVQES